MLSPAKLISAEAEPNSSPHSVPSAAVDLAHLRRYTFGDHGLEREVLGLFLAQLPETLASLSAATTERDWKMAAHALKGSSRAIGAWHLGDLAEKAEKHPLLAAGDARNAAFDNLHEAAVVVRAFIHAVYGAPQA